MYIALDASRQGHGSRDLFMILVRHLLVSEELCRLGLGPDELANIENAHAAIVRLDAAKHRDGVWVLGDNEYSRLCAALAIQDAQLSIASLGTATHYRRPVRTCSSTRSRQ